MKRNLIFASFIIMTIITSLTNCKQESVEITLTPNATCRISKSVNEIQYDIYKQIETTDYQYDTQDNLIKKTFVIDRATKAENVRTETFTYNSNGFLIEKTMKNVIAEPNTSIRQNLETAKYTYTNDLLTSIETTITDNKGVVSLESEKIAYITGNTIKSREKRTQDGTISTSTYENCSLVDFVVKTSAGIMTRPYTIQNGLITKITGSGYYTINTFNEKRQMVKTEIFVNGMLNSYSTFEWSDIQSAEGTIKDFKGIPCEVNLLLMFR